MKNKVTFLCVMMFLSSALLAQVNESRPQVPPGFIDGVKNPDLIPDMTAYRLVFLSLSSQSAIDKQDSKIKKILLTEGDANALKDILGQFSSQYTAFRLYAKPGNGAAAQSRNIVQQTRDLLVQKLTPDGVAKFAMYVQRAKSQMIVRP